MTTFPATTAIVALLLGVSTLPTTVRGQATAAICGAGYDWATNSRGQTPCLVAAYMAGACSSSGQFTIPALPNSTSLYTAPEAANANACVCSSVVYSLISACADCSAHPYLKWTTWSENCVTAYVGVFNRTVPSGTAVPSWAYIDVTRGDGYNATQAQMLALQGAPETTGTSPQPTSTITPPSASPTPTKKSTNAGAIAGGVIGGVVGLALLAAGIWYFLRRRERSMRAAAERDHGGHTYALDGHGDDTYSTAPAMSYADTSYTVTTSPPPKLYDPEDPSTFPSSPVMTNDHSSIAPSFPGTTRPHHHAGPGGQYSGAAEI